MKCKKCGQLCLGITKEAVYGSVSNCCESEIIMSNYITISGHKIEVDKNDTAESIQIKIDNYLK